MHPLIEKCVERLENVLYKKAKDINNEIELKQLMGNLTMDVIASCAFGTQIDTHNEPNNQFIKNAQKVFRGNWRVWVFFMLKTTFPKILDIIHFEINDPTVKHFFQSAVNILNSRVFKPHISPILSLNINFHIIFRSEQSFPDVKLKPINTTIICNL